MFRNALFAAPFAVAALVMAPAALAAEPIPFTKAAFEQAQAQNKPILVDIYAPWCPVCRAQEPVIDRMAAKPENADLIIFRVDFDNQKDVVRQFRAQRQSTLIAYRGREETGRNVGATGSVEIDRLLASTRGAPAR